MVCVHVFLFTYIMNICSRVCKRMETRWQFYYNFVCWLCLGHRTRMICGRCSTSYLLEASCFTLHIDETGIHKNCIRHTYHCKCKTSLAQILGTFIFENWQWCWRARASSELRCSIYEVPVVGNGDWNQQGPWTTLSGFVSKWHRTNININLTNFQESTTVRGYATHPISPCVKTYTQNAKNSIWRPFKFTVSFQIICNSRHAWCPNCWFTWVRNIIRQNVTISFGQFQLLVQSKHDESNAGVSFHMSRFPHNFSWKGGTNRKWQPEQMYNESAKLWVHNIVFLPNTHCLSIVTMTVVVRSE